MYTTLFHCQHFISFPTFYFIAFICTSFNLLSLLQQHVIPASFLTKKFEAPRLRSQVKAKYPITIFLVPWPGMFGKKRTAQQADAGALPTERKLVIGSVNFIIQVLFYSCFITLKTTGSQRDNKIVILLSLHFVTGKNSQCWPPEVVCLEAPLMLLSFHANREILDLDEKTAPEMASERNFQCESSCIEKLSYTTITLETLQPPTSSTP